MPSLVHKLVIFAAVEGLILQPLGHRQQPPPPPILIEYKTRRLTSLKSPVQQKDGTKSFESHGIIGLLKVSTLSFLISITGRKQVAQIHGRPIYVITGVAITPLASQDEAAKAIEQTRENLKKPLKDDGATSATSDEESDQAEAPGSVMAEETEPQEPESPVKAHKRVGSTVAKDVIQKKGLYGRFAESWFSRKGWDAGRRRSQGMSPENSAVLDPAEDSNEDAPLPEPLDESAAGRPDGRKLSVVDAEELTSSLIPKLLHTTRLLLSSGGFFYSYEQDITRRLGTQIENRSELPLHQLVDPLFFWNHILTNPFIRDHHDAYVLPVMQGFVGQRAFTIEIPKESNEATISETLEDPVELLEMQNAESKSEKKDKPADTQHNFLLTLISRRSIKRPGLRYLRRGIDDQGNTANAVETEQILSVPSWDPSSKTYSFVGLRGSIPLYFSQSPYAFKPTPVLHHSIKRNQEAFQRHFANITRTYGTVYAALLVDKRGGEAMIGEEYKKQVQRYNDDQSQDSKIGFEWFDFHAECRGMKFENVSILTSTLDEPLNQMGETVKQGGAILERQHGIVRTNCMDCLDRTNVVQSALAQRMLQHQLKLEGLSIDLQTDNSTRWFNTLWADNGDAISKQYSSTAALKGDYTRTRKRNYRGALNDFGLTLSRYYNNIVNDYFSQAVIDYLLGNVTASVFEEFEATMMSVDPGVSLDSIRQNAIEVCAKVVISDKSEELIGGWALLSPHQPNTLRTLPLEEGILLLTDAAIYGCKFDWNTEKVLLFQRVDLRSIKAIRYGTYITSTTSSVQTNESTNVGLVVIFKPGTESVMRVNTRSLESSVEQKDQPESNNLTLDIVPENLPTAKNRSSALLAFKALSAQSLMADKKVKAGKERKPIDSVRQICEDIERSAMAGEGHHVERKSLIEETDIISLAEARKRTGYIESLGYTLKRLVWT